MGAEGSGGKFSGANHFIEGFHHFLPLECQCLLALLRQLSLVPGTDPEPGDANVIEDEETGGDGDGFPGHATVRDHGTTRSECSSQVSGCWTANAVQR